ncbi:MAG: Hsp33 family molecular chaperone HslO [Methylococcaceae bacterium]|nr:Hsp33 family molecular chaperone HslO [Methylococcaceae bacterium]
MNQQDILRRFVFEALGVRGEWVRLEQSWQSAKQHQQGNALVLKLLGESLAAVVLLSATIKFKGSLILQAQGTGDLKTLVVQSSDDRQIRGLIRGNGVVAKGSLSELFGEGFMVLTIESESAEPYQGIVPLEGNTIAEALQTYFVQSEQLQTRLWLFANETHAVGLLLQELPSQGTYKEDWARIEILANTVTEQELMTLSCEDMLYRLFNEDKVTLYEPEAVSFACSCSQLKIEQTLYSMGRKELEEILAERPQIEVHCEFCGGHYAFDKVDVERILLAGATIKERPATRH